MALISFIFSWNFAKNQVIYKHITFRNILHLGLYSAAAAAAAIFCEILRKNQVIYKHIWEYNILETSTYQICGISRNFATSRRKQWYLIKITYNISDNRNPLFHPCQGNLRTAFVTPLVIARDLRSTPFIQLALSSPGHETVLSRVAAWWMMIRLQILSG